MEYNLLKYFKSKNINLKHLSNNKYIYNNKLYYLTINDKINDKLKNNIINVEINTIKRNELFNKNNYTFDKQGRLLVGAIVSTVADFYERSVALINAGCDIIYIEYINKIDQQIIEKLKELNENVVITVK